MRCVKEDLGKVKVVEPAEGVRMLDLEKTS